MQVTRRLSIADLAAGGLTTAAGAFFIWGAIGIDRRPGVIGGPHIMPMTASLLLLGLGVVILSLAFTRRSAGPDAETSPPTQSPGLFPFAFVGGGLLYVFAIDAVGYLPATLVGAPFAFAAFGARGIVRMILAGLAAATVIYLIFFVGLGLYDPPGRLFSWRDLWGG